MQARRFYAVRTPGVRLDLHGRRAADGLAHLAHRGHRRSTVQGERQRPDGEARAGHERRRGRGERDRAASPLTAGRDAAERYYFVRALARGQADRLLEPGLGDRAPRARARRRRVARGRPARPHLLLARRLLPAERRQHRAGGVLHARPARRRSASSRRARAASTTSRSPTTTTCARPPTRTSARYGVTGIPAYENSLHGHAQMLRRDHASTTTATAPRPR